MFFMEGGGVEAGLRPVARVGAAGACGMEMYPASKGSPEQRAPREGRTDRAASDAARAWAALSFFVLHDERGYNKARFFFFH